MGCVRLESVEYKGQYIGIKDNGEILPPSEAGTGIESMFQVMPVSIATYFTTCIIIHYDYSCLFCSSFPVVLVTEARTIQPYILFVVISSSCSQFSSQLFY